MAIFNHSGKPERPSQKAFGVSYFIPAIVVIVAVVIGIIRATAKSMSVSWPSKGSSRPSAWPRLLPAWKPRFMATSTSSKDWSQRSQPIPT